MNGFSFVKSIKFDWDQLINNPQCIILFYFVDVFILNNWKFDIIIYMSCFIVRGEKIVFNRVAFMLSRGNSTILQNNAIWKNNIHILFNFFKKSITFFNKLN